MIVSDQSRQVDWYVRKGSDTELLLTFTAGGGPYDTSSLIITCEVQTLERVILNPTIVNEGATGLVYIRLTNSQTEITPDQYFWTLKIQTPIGFDMMVINGKFVINDFLWDSQNINKTSTLQITI